MGFHRKIIVGPARTVGANLPRGKNGFLIRFLTKFWLEIQLKNWLWIKRKYHTLQNNRDFLEKNIIYFIKTPWFYGANKSYWGGHLPHEGCPKADPYAWLISLFASDNGRSPLSRAEFFCPIQFLKTRIAVFYAPKSRFHTGWTSLPIENRGLGFFCHLGFFDEP
jgi:hypothetical protein